MDRRVKPAYDYRRRAAPTRPPPPPRASHANPSRQRIRHGLSRYRPGPAAGVRARLAVRFPHLVVGARSLDAKASGDRGQSAALFSRALGRHRRHLLDRAARRRHDRLYREARRRAGRPDGAFPRRTHLVSRRAAAARSVAQADPGRARRRARPHARSGRQARGALPARGAVRGVGRKDRGRRRRRRAGIFHGHARGPGRLGAAAGDAEATAARQRR